MIIATARALSNWWMFKVNLIKFHAAVTYRQRKFISNHSKAFWRTFRQPSFARTLSNEERWRDIFPKQLGMYLWRNFVSIRFSHSFRPVAGSVHCSSILATSIKGRKRRTLSCTFLNEFYRAIMSWNDRGHIVLVCVMRV